MRGGAPGCCSRQPPPAGIAPPAFVSLTIDLTIKLIFKFTCGSRLSGPRKAPRILIKCHFFFLRFGDKCPQNVSNNEVTAPTTTLTGLSCVGVRLLVSVFRVWCGSRVSGHVFRASSSGPGVCVSCCGCRETATPRAKTLLNRISWFDSRVLLVNYSRA